MLSNLTIADPGNGTRLLLQDTGHKYQVGVAAVLRSPHHDVDETALLLRAAPDLVALIREMMAAHRAQLPSEARDLYGGGCGCPLCERARGVLEGL